MQFYTGFSRIKVEQGKQKSCVLSNQVISRLLLASPTVRLPCRNPSGGAEGAFEMGGCPTLRSHFIVSYVGAGTSTPPYPHVQCA